MTVTDNSLRALRRRLIVRDSLVFVSLASITIVLFLITLFLFRSFSAHRIELAQRWFARGEKDLAANRPLQAVSDLRTALSYDPSETNYQLMLAQALSDAGNTSEAYAYFTNLWEAQPGSGPLNLQLARLTAKMRKPREAVQYYRAAVYGTWEGDGSVRRREVRLELIRYLMDQKDFATAQTELLIAAGNASDDPGLELELASLMAGSGDYNSALPLYQNVIKASPSNGSAFEGAGVAAFQLARYPDARRYLEVAQRFLSEGDRGGLTTNAASLLQQSQRILELNPSPSLPDRERVKRILAARSLAQQRLNWCHLQLAAAGDSPAELTELDNLWNSPDAKTLPARLRGDSELQQQTMQSVYHTEIVTNNACGAPSGDDALLLLLAKATGNNQ